MADLPVTADGVSPSFTITAEDFLLRYFTQLTPVDIDGVPPPVFGVDGGVSTGMDYVNLWFPWIDEKIVEPKYDGVCVYFGVPSNRPTFIKDYHMISLFRACDYLLQPIYQGSFQATVSPVIPNPPGT